MLVVLVSGSEVSGTAAAALVVLVFWTCCFLYAHLHAAISRPALISSSSPLTLSLRWWEHAVSEYGSPHSLPVVHRCIMLCWWSIAVAAALLAASFARLFDAVHANNNNETWNKDDKATIALLSIFAFCRVATSLAPIPVHVSDDGSTRITTNDILSASATATSTSVGSTRDHEMEMGGAAGADGDARRGSVSIERSNAPISRSMMLLHLIFAALSFGSIIGCGFEVSNSFSKLNTSGSLLLDDSTHSSLFTFTKWFMLVMGGVMFLSRRCARSMFGLVERLFYLSHILFLYACAATLIQQAGQL